MSNYKKCDCCGKLKPEEDLEEATITIKKCKGCEVVLPVSPILLPSMQEVKPRSPYKNPPASVSGVFGEPKELRE